jgi:hypothetical protein
MPREVLRLKVNGSRVSADLVRGARTLWSGEAEYTGMEDLAEVIARVAVEPDLVRPRTAVRVELERPVVQCRVLHDLPPVSKSALRSLVEQQAHRYFRKNGKPLVVDACYLSRSDRRKGVHVAATEEPVVGAIWAGVRAAGLTLERVSAAGQPAILSLLPLEERQRRHRENRLSLRRLGTTAVVLWLLAGTATALSTNWQRRAVDRVLVGLAEPVAALATIQREIAAGSAMIAALESDAARRTAMIELLASVTGAVPDSAFLTSLTVDSAGRGFLGGYARRSSEVVARLERSAAVTAPRLEVQPGREVIGGIEWERFSIAFGSETE